MPIFFTEDIKKIEYDYTFVISYSSSSCKILKKEENILKDFEVFDLKSFFNNEIMYI